MQRIQEVSEEAKVMDDLSDYSDHIFDASSSDEGESEDDNEILSDMNAEKLDKLPEEEMDLIYPNNLQDIIVELDHEIPPVPDKPQVVQENPPPFLYPRETVGSRAPKASDGGDKKKGGGAKKGKSKSPKKGKKGKKGKKDKKGKKKGKGGDKQKDGDAIPKPSINIDFEVPLPAPKPISELIKAEENEIYSHGIHLSLLEDQCYTAVRPCLIKEALMIPDSPTDVRTLLESSNLYMIKRQYKKALDALQQAKQEWLRIEEATNLKAELEIYFNISIGQVYEETNNLRIALRYYMKAKTIELTYNHPDKAIPFSSLGCVLLMLDQHDAATRCFIKAREIREERMGGDTVDCASTYNNLGCCMMLLQRNQEANTYFELSYVILDTILGSNHERTLCAKNNLKKSKHKFLDVKPTYPRLWYAAVPDPLAILKGKKKKKGKKGKKKKK
ncbi:unnamed protein product [Moneuplotes crassus]|uniref:Uncharacterized protein n=1 Tax=Euplotes crassus TaxID=5936 RepID=A0AAD1UPB7_EUPCR|nr:unnamed protein product [Moneuplotes crassus]